MTRSHTSCRWLFLSVALLLLTFCPPARAADSSKRQLLRTLQKVRPSFQITPIVHDFNARRGQLLNFEYIVEALGEDVTLLIRPCALRQEENGVVLPDDLAAAPDNIQLETPAVLAAKAGARLKIKGRLRVPPTNTTFHSFGILVKNVGGQPVGDDAVARPGERKLSVKFVTQYLLRCDIRVVGARGSALRDLEVKSAELVDKDGHAQARVIIHNPTESPLEFETRCRFQKVGGAAPKQAFPMMLPVRSSLDEPERFIARILPKATVRVENLLPHPVFSGEHLLGVEVHWHGRVQQRGEFPIDVTSGDYPAQDASVVRVASDVVVSPSQIELSLQRGGRRQVPVTIENTSLQRLTVHLSHEGGDEGSLDFLRIRPDTIQLEPGKQAKAMVSLQSGSEISTNHYAALRIGVTPEAGTIEGSRAIPIAVLARSDEQPDLHAVSIRWTDETHRSALKVTMTNLGTRHAELNPRLRLADGFGRGIMLNGGYGKWLLPGESADVVFPLVAVPPPGLYQAEVLLDVPDEEPRVLVADEVVVP